MPGREDYILSFIALLRQALAQLVNLRVTGRYEEALQVASGAQEKLFGRRRNELAQLDLAELLRLLRLDETAPAADEKVLAYATLLRETGLIYAAMDRRDSAQGCFQLALQVRLTVAVAAGQPSDDLLTSLRDLLARIPPEQLHAPVRDLLEQVSQKRCNGESVGGP